MNKQSKELLLLLLELHELRRSLSLKTYTRLITPEQTWLIKQIEKHQAALTKLERLDFYPLLIKSAVKNLNH